jgi:signal peptidase
MAKKMLHGAGMLVVAVAMLIALLMAVTFVPTMFGLQSLIVGSGSMGSAMPVGSVALTREVDARAISVGDIVSYRQRGAESTTTHRVIAVEIQGDQVVFTTKGDANASPDPQPVYIDRQIHRVEHIVPYAGYVARYARTPLGLIILIIIPLIGLTFDHRFAKRRRRGGPAEVGWSVTTQSLLRASDPFSAIPSG